LLLLFFCLSDNGQKGVHKITNLLLHIVKSQVCLQAAAAFHLLYLIEDILDARR